VSRGSAASSSAPGGRSGSHYLSGSAHTEFFFESLDQVGKLEDRHLFDGSNHFFDSHFSHLLFSLHLLYSCVYCVNYAHYRA